MIAACHTGDATSVGSLLAAKADPNETDADGQTIPTNMGGTCLYIRFGIFRCNTSSILQTTRECLQSRKHLILVILAK